MGNGRVKQLKKIAIKTMEDAVKTQINERCDRIEKYVQDYLKRLEDREKQIRSWLVQEVKFKLQNDLHNANCTIDAVAEILAEANLGIPDFAAKIDAKKKEISKRKLDEADAKMQAEMEERAKSAEQSKLSDAEQPKESSSTSASPQSS
jgi:hypothetical protein